MKKTYCIILYIIILFSFVSTEVFAQAKKMPAKILKNNITAKKIDVLNSSYPETNLSITPDGKYLFFMSENPSTWSTKNYNGIGRYDGDIWYSQKADGNWQKPKNLGRTINTPQGEDEPNVSPDGQTVYFQSWRTDWRTTGGPYYKAELSGSNWRNLQGLNSGITEFFKSKDPNNSGGLATDGATFSPDGKKFIVAFGKNYNDNMDLYMSKKDSRGNWSDFKKISLNTSGNERCPFLAADGKTLYFASNGYDGFGKLDIYKTTLNDDGTCGEVLNIGEPFNTKDDDYGFVLTASGNEAYFVRNGDIYYADLKKSTEDLKPNPMVILSGVVRDSLTGKPIESTVKIKDMSNNQDIATSRSNSNSGEYSVVLPVGKKYMQIVTKKGYNDFSRTFSIPEAATVKELKYDVNLLAAGAVVQTIENKPVITQDSIPVKKDPEIKIIRDTASIIKPKKDTVVPVITPVRINDSLEYCKNKFYLYHNFSVGFTGSIPLSYGLKVEYDYRNFGIALGALHFPQIGELDETKPGEEYKDDNFSNLFLLAFTYHFPINCKFYPLIGVYGGMQFREWKKDVGSPIKKDIQSGNYIAKHYGAAIGLKYFLNPVFYLEGSLGFGTNSVHSQPSGDLIRWDSQILAWLGICCNFQLK
jgi:Tol biopolymer transport system component